MNPSPKTYRSDTINFEGDEKEACAFLLGIFDGVGTPAIMNGFLDLPGIRDLRPVDALAIENTVLQTTNSAAPMVYGLIISLAANGSFVFGILGGAFIVAGVVCFAVNKAFLRV